MWRRILILAGLAVLAACSSNAEKEEVFVPFGPKSQMYCYDNLGKVTCYEQPVHRDRGRLVWYPGADQRAP